VHVAKDGAGRYAATLQSPDQGSVILPIAAMATETDHLSFTIPGIAATYSGLWSAETSGWVGTWTQGASSLPLILSRMTGQTSDLASPQRPQEDAIAAGPLPYRLRDVTFTNEQAGITLAGTLSLPGGTGPFPAVILINGSGPNGRDEDIQGHKIFAVLADFLTRQGIAVLRYDKRGIGSSGGNFRTATTKDFTDDADAALRYLKTSNEIDADHLGLIGHSEGGIVAPALSIRNPDARFIVLLAGPGMRFDRLLLRQADLIARADGQSADQVAQSHARRETLFAAIAAAPDSAAAKTIAQSFFDKAVATKIMGPDDAKVRLEMMTSPWFLQILQFDPLPTLRQVTVPVLALNGSLDLQVPSRENLEAIREALKDDRDVTIREIPGLNHLFQRAKTGSPQEYGKIQESFAPDSLAVIADWVLAHSR
jgi:pimeloyl-ACP methyl ester carboxylesterase